jgi:hypothetical protein
MKSKTRRAGSEAGSGRVNFSAPAVAVAMSTRTFLDVANRELRRVQSATQGNQRRILRTGVARLGDMGLINAWERGRLDRICDLVLVAGRSQDVTRRLQAIYDEMIGRGTGGLALSIAEITANLDRVSATRPLTSGDGRAARADSDPNIGHLMIGGVAGALAGGLAGGPVGAVIGFVAGWVGRGFMEAC